MDKVFTIKFECVNCNNVWQEDFYKGDHISKRYVFGGVLLESHECTHTVSCPFCHDIECPCCGSHESVSILERHPL